MRLKLLVATPSAYRRKWYLAELGRHGFDVTAVTTVAECVERLHATRPDVLLLESSLHWGGADGVMTARNEDETLREIPVVLVAIDGVSSEVYSLAGYPVQVFFSRQPSSHELAVTLNQLVPARRRTFAH